MNSSKRRRPILLLAAAVAAGLVAWWLWGGVSGDGPPERAARQAYAPVAGPLRFPPAMAGAPPGIFDLYEFAARRPDVMHYLPCFCGCWRVGHESAYDCFVDEVRANGTVEVDDMGFT